MSIIEVKVDDNDSFSISNKEGELFVNDGLFNGEIIKVSNNIFKVFKANQIFRVELVERHHKSMKIKINDQLLDVAVTDHIDHILDKLGMNIATSAAIKDVNAPMPGSILNIIVEEGAEVSQGDQLLVLEAMKMENVIKSPGEGKVSKIHVTEKENVEKNQVLISFE